MTHSPGNKFRSLLTQEKPLQIVGTINAYIALMAKQVGIKAIYLSGAGVANSSFGLPDLGITNLNDVLEDARRITSAVDLPLLVDIDTGFGNRFMIERTIKELEKVGVAAVHIEDQEALNKRCGHRPKKQIVSIEEMCDRIKAAVSARLDPDFVIMARTDAFEKDGLEGVIKRAKAYKEAGADMLFAEAISTLYDYTAIKDATGMPILANLTEFGKTPLFTTKELHAAKVDMALYPLSVNRAMNFAALNTLKELFNQGTQKGVIDQMQTRKELYAFLNYESYENHFNKE